MKKKFIVKIISVGMFILILQNGYGQSENGTYIDSTNKHKNKLYFELVGKGNTFNLYYERTILNSKYAQLDAQVGVSPLINEYIPEWKMPIGITVSGLKTQIQPEIGGGIIMSVNFKPIPSSKATRDSIAELPYNEIIDYMFSQGIDYYSKPFRIDYFLTAGIKINLRKNIIGRINYNLKYLNIHRERRVVTYRYGVGIGIKF